MEFELMELDNGDMVFAHEDGRIVDVSVVNLMFELHKQNPDFYEHWMELAKSYVLVSPAMVEA